MSTDLRQAASVDRTLVASRVHRRRAWFLLAFAAWNVWVWATRLVNLLGDGQEHSAAFIAVHVVLYVGGFGGAAVLTVMGVRMLREARRGAGSAEVETP